MLTKLEAVNIILAAIGEEEVHSLSSGLPDAEAAERVLDRTIKQVLSRGWHCNTDRSRKFIPDASKHIPLPTTTCLRIDTVGMSANRNVTVRFIDGVAHLYDIGEQTFEFSSTLLCDAVWLYDFESLTASLRDYIAYRAARIFQEGEMGSRTLDESIRRLEAESLAALQDAEADSEDSNILIDSPHCFYTTYRNSFRFGRT